ncbi:hypothetical protein MDX13_002950 [Klebsiella pneumoniae]
MRELTAFEIENVSGAGWLQDGLAALGSKVGAAAWTMGTDALSINLPLLGTLNLADLAPDLGKTLGESVGSTIGGTIESALAGLPVIEGACFRRLFALLLQVYTFSGLFTRRIR